jgi:hypothetical protein
MAPVTRIMSSDQLSHSRTKSSSTKQPAHVRTHTPPPSSFIGPDDRSPYHRAGDDGHITPSADEAFATGFHSATYQPELAPDQTSSIPEHVFASNPRPRSGRPADRSALGKKRKRADSDQSGRTAPGFQMRESANQIEENRRETLARSRESTSIAKEPSRSESPFDNRDAESTSDGLDSMPPLRPQQAASMLPPRARSRRHQSPQDPQPGESVLEANELPNIRYAESMAHGTSVLYTDKIQSEWQSPQTDASPDRIRWIAYQKRDQSRLETDKARWSKIGRSTVDARM